jgi:hypothetical protein
MIVKSINSKIGRVHCLRVNRVVKKTDGQLKKEPFTFVLTDVELKNLQKDIARVNGDVDEHLLAVPVDRRVAHNSFIEPEHERRKENLILMGDDLEIEV